MIQIKIDDTIVDIVDKMELEKSKEIILVFPLWHPILHNYISLKIIKSKAKNRKLIIATNDTLGKKIGKKIGITYSTVKSKSFLKDASSQSLLGHNYTFLEYLKYQLKSYKSELFYSFQNQKKFHSIWKYSRASYEKVWVSLFLLWLIVSISLFCFIYYFAISKSYIEIKPEIIIKQEAHNFVFTQEIKETILWNNRYVKITPVAKTLYSSDTYAGTEILENNNIATWEIQIYNKLEEEQTLIPNTRFTTEDWLVFRTDTWINVPAWVVDNFWNVAPWIAVVWVKSDIKDNSWSFVWERWNIKKWITLIVPGLPEDLRKDIYWISLNDFTWWSNDYKRAISQGDIDRAIEIFTKKIQNEIIISIKNDILTRNKENNTNIDILPWADSIQYSSVEINIEPWVSAWVVRDKFKLEWNITAQVYTYNREIILQKLKTLFNEKKLDWIETIWYFDENSLRMSETISKEDNPFSMKSTFEMEAVFFHDFLNEENNFTESLKQQIRWIPKQEAESYLLNNPQISTVNIRLRPFFSKNISNIKKNIIFDIK